MTHTITVNVTADDIKYGAPNNGNKCPIHRSLLRHKQFQKLENFYVGGMWISGGRGKYIAKLPPEAMTFIRVFDGKATGETKPFKFELEIDL